jgi:hypothetical protein
MLGEETGRPAGRRFGTASELGSYNDSRQATLRGGNAGVPSERDSLLHHDELDGGGTLKRQGFTKLNLGSIKGGRDLIKLTDNHQTKHFKRYDDKSAGIFDEHDAFLDKNASAEEASKALMKKNSMLKRLSRMLLFGLIVGFLLALPLIVNRAADVNKEYTIENVSEPLKLVLPNCYVYLVNSGQESGVRITLKAIDLLFTPSIIFDRKRVTQSLELIGGSHVFTLDHEDDDYACGVAVHWPTSQELSSLTIECQYCTLVASSEVRIGLLTVSGKGVNSNFRDLKVGTMNYSVVSGVTELQEVQFGANSNFNVTNGTVTVQSRSDFTVNLKKANDLYCFSAPTVASNSISCSTEKLTDDILKNLYNISEYSQCSGSASLCKGTPCSPSVTLTFETLVGSFYGNLLTVKDSITVPDSNSLAAGSRYFKDISLNPSDYQNLLQILKNSDHATRLPLILKVDVGNFKGTSSAATKYIVTEYPLTSVTDPWTVAGLTMGIFTYNYQELAVFLSPGFCPYRPSLSRQQ